MKPPFHVQWCVNLACVPSWEEDQTNCRESWAHPSCPGYPSFWNTRCARKLNASKTVGTCSAKKAMCQICLKEDRALHTQHLRRMNCKLPPWFRGGANSLLASSSTPKGTLFVQLWAVIGRVACSHSHSPKHAAGAWVSVYGTRVIGPALCLVLKWGTTEEEQISLHGSARGQHSHAPSHQGHTCPRI